MVKAEKIPEGYRATEAGILPVDWQVKRLSEIATELTERAGQDMYETVSISAGIGFVNQAEKFGKELSGKQYEKYIVLHKGDFSYNKGNSKTSPQGCIYRLNDRESAAVPNVFESFRIKEQDTDYYEQLFLSGFLNRQLYSRINRGVRDDGLLNLTGKDFYSCTVPVPPVDEQKKIAEVLLCCDRVINLKQQLIVELQRLKSGFLQAMFPAKGHSEPDIRFPEFSDAWEQRKLSELCEKFTDGDWIEAKDQSDSGVRLIQTGNIGVTEYLDKPSNKKWVSEKTFERLRCEEVLPGDILISRLPEPAGRACIMPYLGTKMITAVDCTIVRTSEKYSSKYLVQFLSTQDYFNEVNTALAGGTRQRISRSNLALFGVPMPPSFEEQQAIGDFFSQFDNLITFHQRELEETKKKKKSLAKLLLTGSVRVPT
ncbi:hypothetical protein K190097F3_03810 [Enterocloster clostridioformis]|uniref:restriction endonuclease subunit S n=2 Tax=Lachnospiraceae TaxID=186803 RepID=UPI002675861A|nr:restriction endonuclease subunit S [Enterocloster bolteae]